ncbi:Fem-1-like protein B [Daphnia sinensis]|uniref:Fem-1-like protein B n=1 Tax=Daphnia sinensis TaxID=1820382 RepID=A0AAD5PW48_9CRUS|nr:Fem-1-like protein B [Daphnia sinensis]
MSGKEDSELLRIETLRERIFFAARDGLAITLYALLSELNQSQQSELLSQITEEQGQRCTPLLIAARNGKESVVKMLLSQFKPNIEQEGDVKFDGYLIEGASPLWCAAGAGHLKVVKALVKAGADVNHPTKTFSTPLRAASFDGRLDIVKYLIEHKADIHLANKYNNTCLMIAAFKGHLEVVKCLLEQGADPNQKAHCGATALHFSAECGHVAIVRELIEYGTKITLNEQGMSPLLCAAERTKSGVVDYLMTRPEFSRRERIEALELLGASFANDKDSYNIDLAYNYLHRAMEMRFEDPQQIVPKQPVDPIEAYENWREVQTLAELESIRHNPNAIHMESLVIRERILSVNNPELPHPIVFRGAVFADDARFDRCISLWLHALRLRQRMQLTVSKDLLRFAQVFSQVLHVGLELPFNVLEEVLASTAMELERNQTKISNPGPKDDIEVIAEEMDCNVTTALYLVTITTKLLSKATSQQEHTIYRHVFKLNRLNVRSKEGSSLLHLAASADTPVDEFHTVDICRFPCASTCKLLIQCGFDVNAMDHRRNTPLHLIVGYPKPISDFVTLHSIIMTLIEAGAHMDAVNSYGETPFDAATTGVAEIILRTQSKLSLKCIAAKAIKRYALNYEGLVPTPLVSFIELHGSGTTLR